MNTRDYKPFAEGEYYHIYNRGNGRQKVFVDDGDYLFFLRRLREALYPLHTQQPLAQNQQQKEITELATPRRKQLPENAFTLVAYCLMPNHFHFFIQQNSSLEVSKLISKLCTSYSKYFNKKYDKTGGLFQAKFRAVHITSDEYFLWLSAYIHTNPSVAGIVSHNKDYAWSSYQDYIGIRNGTLCNKKVLLDRFNNSTTEYERYTESCQPLIMNRKYLKSLRLDEIEEK